MSDDFNIQNIAKLASINLSEEEQSKLSNDLSVILEHVQALSDLSLDEIGEIFIHPLEKELLLDEDEIRVSLTHDEALQNAPEKNKGKFVVPPSLE